MRLQDCLRLASKVDEPGFQRRALEAGVRFLALPDMLLHSLSALDAHRARLPAHGD